MLTILCCLRLYNKNQHIYTYIHIHISPIYDIHIYTYISAYIYIYILTFLSLPPSHLPHPTPIGYHTVLGWAPCFIFQLPVSYQFYTWWLYIYMLVLLSQLALCFPNPAMSTRPFSTSASLFLPCKWVHEYHFSIFHICTLYNSRFIYLISTDSNLFLFMPE